MSVTAGAALPAAATTSTPDAQFVIPAAESFQQSRPRILKEGDTFGVFNHSGDATGGPTSAEGLYHHDTRHLAQFCLTINGAWPVLLSSTLRDDNSILTCDLANPDFHSADGRNGTDAVEDWPLASYGVDADTSIVRGSTIAHSSADSDSDSTASVVRGSADSQSRDARSASSDSRSDCIAPSQRRV